MANFTGEFSTRKQEQNMRFIITREFHIGLNRSV